MKVIKMPPVKIMLNGKEITEEEARAHIESKYSSKYETQSKERRQENE